MDGLDGRGVRRSDTNVAEWKVELDHRIEEARQAAREYGASPGDPEGRFVGAVLATIIAHSRIAEAAERRVAAAVVEERQRLGDLHTIADRTLAQMRNGIISFEIQRDMAVTNFMEKTAPVFASEMGKALAIREKRWNFNLRMMWLAGAVAALVIAFVAGGAVIWSEHREAVLWQRACLARPHVAGNQLWCPIPQWAADQIAAASRSPAAGAQSAR